jgi:nitrogen regulatory protein PII
MNETVLVVATLPLSSLDAVEKALQQMGVCELTVARVRGYGQYVDFLSRDHLVDQVKIEALVARAAATRVVEAILEASNARRPGEGTVALFNAEAAFNVRACSTMLPDPGA